MLDDGSDDLLEHSLDTMKAEMMDVEQEYQKELQKDDWKVASTVAKMAQSQALLFKRANKLENIKKNIYANAIDKQILIPKIKKYT